jgi:hypothetical protein
MTEKITVEELRERWNGMPEKEMQKLLDMCTHKKCGSLATRHICETVETTKPENKFRTYKPGRFYMECQRCGWVPREDREMTAEDYNVVIKQFSDMLDRRGES